MISHICTIDRVSVAYFDQGFLNTLGNGNIAVFMNDESKVITLRFVDYFGKEEATIELQQHANAWLQEDCLLVLDRSEGGRWRIDCSDSDPEVFAGFQDLLTYFIKYENRHQLRNALALMNPITCKVTEVVSRNVFLDEQQTEATTLSVKEPVIMSEKDLMDGSLGDGTKKVHLMYQTGDALVTGSDWIARSIVAAGHALARGISSQTKKMQDTIEPAPSTIELSETDKQYIDAFININQALFRTAGGLVNRAATATVSGINSFYNDTSLQAEPQKNASRHLGFSLLHSLHNVVGGVAMAAGTILATSRDSVVDMVYKKYGRDAGYLAEKAFGTTNEGVPDVLVYFDSHGVARQVLVGMPQTSVAYFPHNSAPSSVTTGSLYGIDEPPVLAEDSISQYTESVYSEPSRLASSSHGPSHSMATKQTITPKNITSRRSSMTATDDFFLSEYSNETSEVEKSRYVRI